MEEVQVQVMVTAWSKLLAAAGDAKAQADCREE